MRKMKLRYTRGREGIRGVPRRRLKENKGSLRDHIIALQISHKRGCDIRSDIF